MSVHHLVVAACAGVTALNARIEANAEAMAALATEAFFTFFPRIEVAESLARQAKEGQGIMTTDLLIF
ncbi:hypothetical protein ACIA8I_37750 [Streptomyces rishiriensis]|uniref:hypothetical protein n=1 Tax=Streptomyces rishiriensis TaxID=68264 RepID=UPI0037BA2C32